MNEPKTKIGNIALLLILVCLMAVFMMACGGSGTVSPTGSVSGGSVSGTPTQAPSVSIGDKSKVDIAVNALDLIGEYLTDADAAQKKYVGRKVAVKGDITALPDGKGAEMGRAKPFARDHAVLVLYDDTYADAFAPLTLGSSATVYGICRGLDTNNVYIILDMQAIPTLAPTAPTSSP
jgi:hypothetical protein